MNNKLTQAQNDAFGYATQTLCNEGSIWEVLKYMVRLHELSPDAVKNELPCDTGENYIRFFYDEIYQAESENLETRPAIVDVYLHALVTPQEAEQVYGVSPRTLQRWQKKGLERLMINGRAFYDEDELQAFMAHIGHIPGFQRLGNGNLRAQK